MGAGFIYVLENDAIPGLVKIGSTEKHPEERAKELTSTGVPTPFTIAYHRHVSDCKLLERLVHQALESQGLRQSANREFFTISPQEAADLIDTVIAGHSHNGQTDTIAGYLAGSNIYSTTSLPGYDEQIDEKKAEALEQKLTEIACIGYYPALHSLADVFRRNHLNRNKFRQYYQEFLLASQRSTFPARDRRTSTDLGRYVAEYVEYLDEMKCLMNSDFSFVQQFLIDGDRFTYESFIDHVNRFFHGTTKARCLEL